MNLSPADPAGTRQWWQWRALLLLVLGWDIRAQLASPERGSVVFNGITFGAHEFGHLVWRVFGEFAGVAGGSLNQVLLPLLAVALLARQHDRFGALVGLTWLGSSLVDLARYIADARALELDLLGFGEDPQHDWAWLLGHMGALQQDLRIAGIVRGAGALLAFVSLCGGAWVCLGIWQGARVPAPAEPS